jgi:sodium/potassium/calcium exchanger 4
MFIAAAVSLVVTLAYGDLGPYTLNDRHERGIFKGNHGMSASNARTLLSDPITGEYAVGGSMGPGRKLLSGGGSCKEESLPFAGGLIAYFVGVFFMFVGIAIICDDFFVPALEIICEVLQLSDDVAGATFMAAGSSAPELAASTVSLISPDAGSEIGVGTIVGELIYFYYICRTGNVTDVVFCSQARPSLTSSSSSAPRSSPRETRSSWTGNR